jgi:hypothetical protein
MPIRRKKNQADEQNGSSESKPMENNIKPPLQVYLVYSTPSISKPVSRFPEPS